METVIQIGKFLLAIISNISSIINIFRKGKDVKQQEQEDVIVKKDVETDIKNADVDKLNDELGYNG